MRTVIALFAFVACRHEPPADLRPEPLDVVIIPGCPARDDGRLSGCQWQRAVWGAELWEDGATRAFITSGGAVQNRYIEAEGIRDAMVFLGVPPDVIHLETQALHTDENAGYSIRIADVLGFERVGAASHGGQARGMRAMLSGWGRRDAVALPMDLGRTLARMKRDHDDTLSTEPVPEHEWMPLADREKLIAKRRGEARRLPSWWVYSVDVLTGAMRRRGPPEPPVSEPTLRGERHRVDTAPWPDRRPSVADVPETVETR